MSVNVNTVTFSGLCGMPTEKKHVYAKLFTDNILFESFIRLKRGKYYKC